MEQQVGHATYYQNLRSVIELRPDIKPRWVEVTYDRPGGLLERVPIIPDHIKGALRGVLQVRRGLVGEPLDALFFFSQNPAVFHRSLLGRIPTLISLDVTSRQYDVLGAHYDHRPDGHSMIARYKHRASREVFERAKVIVPWSVWAKCSLMFDYGIAEEKIVVIPPGIDLTQWYPLPERQPARLPLQVLFVGGDFERKGGPELVDWFATEGRGRCVLHIVTQYPLSPREGVQVYNGLTRNSPELRQLYRQSDLFVLPSKGETFGHAYVEALASGLPVIATTVGGTADIVRDGVNGFRVEPGREALGKALEIFLGQPELCRSMGQSARAVAEEQFDVVTNSERLVRLLLSISSPR